MRTACIRSIIRGFWAVLASLMTVGAAQAQFYPNQNALTVGQSQNNAIATLRVSGSATQFSIVANRADTQEALRLIFEQAGKEFVLGNNVGGMVTMRLVNKPLRMVLDALCLQTFLRYRYEDATGAFLFERDDEAIRRAIMRMRVLDAALLDQLRSLGLNVANGVQVITPYINTNQQGGQGFGGGGNGGDFGRRGSQPLMPSRNGQLTPLPGATKIKPFKRAKEKETANREEKADGTAKKQARQADGTQADERANALEMQNSDEYQQFLKQNGLVFFRIAKETPAPVSEVLQNLAQQANVQLMLDPDVPVGRKFTLSGTLPPRTLPEALSILSPILRLEWRWIGSSVYVTRSPEFESFYGETKEPRARYGPPSQRGGRGQTPPPNDTKGKQN